MTRVLFMGRKAVAAECLRYVAALPGVTVVGVLTDNHLAVSPTSEAARSLDIPILEWSEARAAAARGELMFDLGLSVLYWRKLKHDLITVPSRGILNFHPAPLPDYKGTGGYNVAILNGHRQWAVSAHYVDAEIDTGPIVDVHWFPIDYERETALTLEAKARAVLLTSFQRVAAAAAGGSGLLPSWPNVGGRYISRAEMEDMKRVRPGDDVARKVRAFFFPPYDGAYVELDGIRYTLVNQAILETLADPQSSSLFTPKSPGV